MRIAIALFLLSPYSTYNANPEKQPFPFVLGAPFDKEIEGKYTWFITKNLEIMQALDIDTSFKSVHEQLSKTSLNAMVQDEILLPKAMKFYLEIQQCPHVKTTFKAIQNKPQSNETLWALHDFHEAAFGKLRKIRQKELPSMKSTIEEKDLIHSWLKSNRRLMLSNREQEFFKIWNILFFALQQNMLMIKNKALDMPPLTL